MDFDVFGHTLHSVHVHCIVVDADKKKHGHTPFCSFICFSDDRVRTDDSKKTNSNHNNIESYSLFFISFKKRLLFSLSRFLLLPSLPAAFSQFSLSFSPSLFQIKKWFAEHWTSRIFPLLFFCFDYSIYLLLHISHAYSTYATQYSVSMISLRINVLRRFVILLFLLLLRLLLLALFGCFKIFGSD